MIGILEEFKLAMKQRGLIFNVKNKKHRAIILRCTQTSSKLSTAWYLLEVIIVGFVLQFASPESSRMERNVPRK